MKQIEVVFCGVSLYLGVLAAVLQYRDEFRVCMMEHHPLQALPEMKMLCPDVLIFEPVTNTSEIKSILCKDNADMIIIAVCQNKDLIEVCLGENWFTSSVDNLVQVIREFMNERETKGIDFKAANLKSYSV